MGMVNMGETGAGKTSLTESIVTGRPYLTKEEDRTQVMDIKTWKISDNDMYTILDQGGHRIYSIVNPYFVARKSILSLTHDISNPCPQRMARTKEMVYTSLHQYGTNEMYFTLTHIDELISQEVDYRANAFQKEITDLLDAEIDTFEKLLYSRHEESFIDRERVQFMKDTCEERRKNIKIFNVSSKTHKGIEDLKYFLTNRMEKDRVRIPLNWIECYNTIRNNNANFWKKQDLPQMTRTRDTSQLDTCLQYFSDTGLVFWRQDNVFLNEYIFHQSEFIIKVFRAIFDHDLRNHLKTDEMSQRFFQMNELEEVLDKYDTEGLLNHKLLCVLLQKYDVVQLGKQWYRETDPDVTVIIELIKVFNIFAEIKSNPESPLDQDYFVPWNVRENKPPTDLDIDWPVIMSNGFITLNIETRFYNNIPINVCEEMCVNIQKYAYEKNYLGYRYAWKDGIQVDIEQTQIFAFRNLSTSSIWLCVRGKPDDLPLMWDQLEDLNTTAKDILRQWMGTIISQHSNWNTGDKDKQKVHKWLLKDVLPKVPLPDQTVYCKTDRSWIPAALVTKMPKGNKEDTEKRIQAVKDYMMERESTRVGKDLTPTTDISIKVDQPDVINLSRQMAQLDSNISAQLAQHQTRSSFENWVLSEQIFRQNQAHAQQNLAQIQMLSRQMNQQQLQLSGENQMLSHQLYQHQAQSSFENRVLSKQMYHQGQELYQQGQVNAQQSHDESRQLASQVVETRQQLADVMRLEGGDASGITLNIQHPIIKEHQKVLEQNLQVDSELLINMLLIDLISIEEKLRIEQDVNSLSRICRVLKLLEQYDDDKVKKFVASLFMCKRDGANYMLGEMIRQSMDGS